jgi:hypothetical protein
MRTLTRNRNAVLMAVAMLTTLAPVARSVPLGSSFTYQGSLVDNGGQASGPYDFRFTLFDADNGGVQIGAMQVTNDVPVSSGVFSVSLDFGSLAFVGEARWLQIELRQGASTGAYTTLPRQKLTGAPYALGLAMPYYGAGNTTGNLMTVQQLGTGNAGYFVNSNSTANLCYGIIGETWSTASQAAGVRGVASASSGLTIGVEGRGTASTSGTGMVGAGSATGGYFSATNTDGYGIYAYGGGTGARIEGTGPDATGLKTYGHGTGLGIYAQNLDVGGPAISAVNNGQGLSNPTLRLINFQANLGMCVYATNNSTWTTARLDQAGAGECIWMRKPTAGNFIVANNGSSDIFWVDSNGITHTKVLEILGGADLSERFDVMGEPELEPGTVVSIDPAHEGKLLVSSEPYDHRVAGIVSGAGGVQPGMLMGHDGTVASGAHPVALTGRVYCRVTASNGPIAPGDLLTTSPKPGYAMRVDDPARAQGAVIGKAMGSLASGEGLVLVLVGLQ